MIFFLKTVEVFPPLPWAYITEIILQTKWGNVLMTNSCFTHNFSEMLQMHPVRLGCIQGLSLWHGFCDAE